ncbi:hypothetical protein GXM_07385 [Nostoc sphaeroides CCNUC1]|uniref:Uncharacterized protein n=1 Tax=Nostoc sphaeroides CCNUC1 TaxID=2653204 RepID=A0A5P8WBF9_9NOSO|nr:hypothetical protein GXM_07385 [Nostoc sphaeroides CCNUC1]
MLTRFTVMENSLGAMRFCEVRQKKVRCLRRAQPSLKIKSKW